MLICLVLGLIVGALLDHYALPALIAKAQSVLASLQAKL